jgi:ATP-dependent DNA helicase RecG
LTLHGQVRDPQFVRVLERIGQETETSFDTHDFLVLDLVHREDRIPESMQPRVRRLADLGIIERLGRGRGVRYFLSRRFYATVGQRGVYTRRKGLDRETNKALLLRHLTDHGTQDGIPLAELQQVLPSLSRFQLNKLLGELREENRVRIEGQRRWARWFPI